MIKQWLSVQDVSLNTVQIACNWIWENPASTHNYKYLEIPLLIILSIVSWERKQMLACNPLQFYSYSWSIYTPTVEWIASWIICHFKIVFTGIANTTSTPIGSGGEPQGGGKRLRPHWKQPNGIHWCYFQLNISHKSAKPMKPVVLWISLSQLSVYLGEKEPFKDHPSTHGHLTSLRNKPWQTQPGQLSKSIHV